MSAAFERPLAVKVGHSWYEIRYVPEKKWLKKYDTQKAGIFWVDSNVILIRMHNDGDVRHENSLRETLMHEILHACWHHANMSGHGKVESDELEEWTVGCLSMQLIQVMADNAPVVEYLQSGTMSVHEGKQEE